MTAEEQAKLLDFGLSRRVDTRVTIPGTFLGTIDFMAPEQARMPSTVDIRADIYGLGGTLFWCLTGQLPFVSKGNVTQALLDRVNQPPPSVRKHVPDLPRELDEVVTRMMAPRPEDRYQTPQAVMQAMLPFLKSDSWACRPCRCHGARRWPTRQVRIWRMPLQIKTPPHVFRILVVDDDPCIREFSRAVLQAEGWQCGEVGDGPLALQVLSQEHYDLMLLDINMPTMNGLEVLQRVRRRRPVRTSRSSCSPAPSRPMNWPSSSMPPCRRLFEQALQSRANAAQGSGGPAAEGSPGPLGPAQSPFACGQCRTGTQPATATRT